MIDTELGELWQDGSQLVGVFRDSWDFDGYARDDTNGRSHAIQFVVPSRDVEPDFVEAFVYRDPQHVWGRDPPVCVGPDVEVSIDVFVQRSEEFPHAVECEKGFTAAEADPLEPEALNIGRVLSPRAEHDPLRVGRRVFVVHVAGTETACCVANPVEE